MTNDEIPNVEDPPWWDEGMTKHECQNNVRFVIRISGFIRISSFVIRHFHNGPLMPPSFLTRQKWIASNSAAANGIAIQCNM